MSWCVRQLGESPGFGASGAAFGRAISGLAGAFFSAWRRWVSNQLENPSGNGSLVRNEKCSLSQTARCWPIMVRFSAMAFKPRLFSISLLRLAAVASVGLLPTTTTVSFRYAGNDLIASASMGVAQMIKFAVSPGSKTRPSPVSLRMTDGWSG